MMLGDVWYKEAREIADALKLKDGDSATFEAKVTFTYRNIEGRAKVVAGIDFDENQKISERK